MVQWPARIDYVTERSFSLDVIYDRRNKFIVDPVDAMKFRHGDRWLCGYVIPPFQRQAVWEEQRSIEFIESIIQGFNPGVWVYNNASDFPSTILPDGREVWFFDSWLIDGQQRFNALDGFWSDRFPVFGGYWSEVSTRDQRRFLSTPFIANELRLNSEVHLKETYFRLNRGGVAHTDDEMALARS